MRASHNTDNLMPHLMGFMSMYCFPRSRPLYLIIASSTDWATPGLKGRGRVLLQGYQEWPNLAQLVCTFFSRWISRRQTLLSSFVSAVHLLLQRYDVRLRCTDFPPSLLVHTTHSGFDFPHCCRKCRPDSRRGVSSDELGLPPKSL